MVKPTSNERTKGDNNSDGFRLQIDVPRKALLILLIALIVPYFIAAGFLLSKLNWQNVFNARSAGAYSEGAIACNPGPWGKLEYIPIKIETPEEFLSIQAFETTDPRWFFANMTQEAALAFMDQAGITSSEHAKLASAKWERVASGAYVTPPNDVVISLQPKARQVIYTTLAQFPENSSQQDVFFFPSEDMATFFDNSGVSD
jgi:hypothetical protein